MYPVLFELGFIKIYSHGLMMAIGVIVGGMILYNLAKHSGLNARLTVDLIIYSVLAGLLGARLMYVVFNAGQFSNWKEFLFIWNGGLVSFGGIITGFLTAWYFLKKQNESWLKWFDLGFLSLLIGWAIGRVGCFLSGDILGKILEKKIIWWDTWPVTLIESSVCLILFFIFLFLFKKQIFKPGKIFGFGLIAYAATRFIIDFTRLNDNQEIWLNMSQFGDILLIFVALVFLIKAKQEV
jgi:phosphatidylglycerol:prolipoprotein diacylglycerol transferase